MPNLINPITVTIETNDELNAFQRMVEGTIEMEDDMFTDDAMMSPTTLRELATKSDTEIREYFSNISAKLYKRNTYLMALNSIDDKFRNAVNATR